MGIKKKTNSIAFAFVICENKGEVRNNRENSNVTAKFSSALIEQEAKWR